MPYYAVANGRSPGVYNSWDECRSQTDHYSGATFKRFDTQAECNAFLSQNAGGGGGGGRGGSYQPSSHSSGSSYSSGGYSSSSYSGGGRSTNAGRHDFQRDNQGYVKVYTDGSCPNNGQAGARAGLGVYFDQDHPLNKSAPVRGRATNNTGEIQAATEAIKTAKGNGVTKLNIHTDSKFVMDSMDKYLPTWKENGWKLSNGEPVKNQADFKELDRVANDGSMDIKWTHVKGHAGNVGNERADQLARDGAGRFN